MKKLVHSFGGGNTPAEAISRELLGGKGAGLAEMWSIGIPVPPGFTITTEVCTYFYGHDGTFPQELKTDVEAALKGVEHVTGFCFGTSERSLFAGELPLIVSVRSGARTSMPGMMDTILNLGLNDVTTEVLAQATGNERFAYDSYRRFIQMYGEVVLDADVDGFEWMIDDLKSRQNVESDREVSAEGWKSLIPEFFHYIWTTTGSRFPQDPHEQLWGAIGAVFRSWNSDRAVTYRRIYGIPESWGTAVTVQAMVFGNMGDDCATGVAFTRNSMNGVNEFDGEYLPNAQGEDVVGGRRTPRPISNAMKVFHGSDLPSMEETMPDAFAELVAVRERLERHYKDMQDIEFTVQQGKLWMLQTRTGKRSGGAAIRIAVDMVREGLISKEDAIRRFEPDKLDELLHPALDPKAQKTVLAKGLAASPGAVSGHIVFSTEDAKRLKAIHGSVILVRIETSPGDVEAMHTAKGIVTSRGGTTSHAAVVARGMGRPCVVGARDLRIDYAERTMTVKNRILKLGDVITIDGSTGEIMLGRVTTIEPELSEEFTMFMGWVDSIRRLKVRTNADTPKDALAARTLGAEGIGLCRTEHMFFETDRILAVREMIMADDAEGRRAALDKILPMQLADFTEIFRIMGDSPVTIRLLDPPLHEFLPKTDREFAELAAATGKDQETIRYRAAALHEVNPMLGHRGCRLGITYPEIYEMQTRAIVEAALRVNRERGTDAVRPEIMVPLVAGKRELDIVAALIRRTAEKAAERTGGTLIYSVGTMIELPRAALMAGEIAETAEFFSFGTNDLTQTTYGLSRDDAGRFLGDYVAQGAIAEDPFVSLDTEGVGELISLAAERGRRRRPKIKLGICGEHGGDPRSIRFCEEVGLDYVSCSPYRVPIARLAAAQAVLKPAA
jgi:pyruvate,orthophosphate dikinase